LPDSNAGIENNESVQSLSENNYKVEMTATI